MPKLIYFFACERVLVNEDSTNPSFISVFDEIASPKPPEGVENPNAAIGWVLVAAWKKQLEDENKVFEQRTIILNPDGVIGAETIIQFEVKLSNHRNAVKIYGFPLVPKGEYHAQLFLREVGEVDWIQVGDYSMEVRYIE